MKLTILDDLQIELGRKPMEYYSVYAIKASADSAEFLLESLALGVGRFGWSSNPACNLDLLKLKVADAGLANLSEDERSCWQPFLLDLQTGDWVIYVNLPEWGKCTLAEVSGSYFWDGSKNDFNHCFKVNPSTVIQFDRNEVAVEPALSQRLKLRGRFWRVYARAEFEALRVNLAHGRFSQPRTVLSNSTLLGRQIEPLLRQITASIQRVNPNYDLEALLETVFRKMPGVRRVVRQGGAGDHGADLIVDYESGLPLPALQTQHTCVVQAKSYVGEHWDTRAVDDIKRAFARNPTADVGLIVSTADASTLALDDAIDGLRISSGKRVELLIGADVARLVLKFGD